MQRAQCAHAGSMSALKVGTKRSAGAARGVHLMSILPLTMYRDDIPWWPDDYYYIPPSEPPRARRASLFKITMLRYIYDDLKRTSNSKCGDYFVQIARHSVLYSTGIF